MKYRKKPVVIEAIRWRGNNLEEVMKFINSEFTFEKDVIYFTKCKYSFLCKGCRAFPYIKKQNALLSDEGCWLKNV